MITKEIKYEKTTNGEGVRENYRNSKISEWLKPTDEEISEPENSNYLNYKNYIVLIGLVVGTCLVWVYWVDISLSSQFLICNKSDPILIYRFLSEQLNTAYDDYLIDRENLAFNLYFKHKTVKIFYR
jgi:hypothetical protein